MGYRPHLISAKLGVSNHSQRQTQATFMPVVAARPNSVSAGGGVSARKADQAMTQPVLVALVQSGMEVKEPPTLAFCGTSMSAPVVSGVVALIAAANPAASSALIRDILLSTTKPLSSLKGKVVTSGMVDAYSAAAVGVASQKRYRISGIVKRRSRGVSRVTIALRLATGPTYRKTVVTSSTGHFTFREIPAGTYTVKASRAGVRFTSSSKRVSVGGNKSVTFTTR